MKNTDYSDPSLDIAFFKLEELILVLGLHGQYLIGLKMKSYSQRLFLFVKIKGFSTNLLTTYTTYGIIQIIRS